MRFIEADAGIFVDQTGLYLLAIALRTYAPKGQTPVIPETVLSAF
jgi:hypothetical protein